MPNSGERDARGPRRRQRAAPARAPAAGRHQRRERRSPRRAPAPRAAALVDQRAQPPRQRSPGARRRRWRRGPAARPRQRRRHRAAARRRAARPGVACRAARRGSAAGGGALRRRRGDAAPGAALAGGGGGRLGRELLRVLSGGRLWYCSHFCLTSCFFSGGSCFSDLYCSRAAARSCGRQRRPRAHLLLDALLLVGRHLRVALGDAAPLLLALGVELVPLRRERRQHLLFAAASAATTTATRRDRCADRVPAWTGREASASASARTASAGQSATCFSQFWNPRSR